MESAGEKHWLATGRKQKRQRGWIKFTARRQEGEPCIRAVSSLVGKRATQMLTESGLLTGLPACGTGFYKIGRLPVTRPMAMKMTKMPIHHLKMYPWYWASVISVLSISR